MVIQSGLIRQAVFNRESSRVLYNPVLFEQAVLTKIICVVCSIRYFEEHV